MFTSNLKVYHDTTALIISTDEMCISKTRLIFKCFQCRKVRTHTEVDQFKIVKEKVCREVPGQECKTELVLLKMMKIIENCSYDEKCVISKGITIL